MKVSFVKLDSKCGIKVTLAQPSSTGRLIGSLPSRVKLASRTGSAVVVDTRAVDVTVVDVVVVDTGGLVTGSLTEKCVERHIVQGRKNGFGRGGGAIVFLYRARKSRVYLA